MRWFSASIVSVLFAALALTGVNCGGDDGDGDAGRKAIGKVVKRIRKEVIHAGARIHTGDDLFASALLTTNRQGSVWFELDSGTECRTKPNSRLLLEPGNGVRIAFRQGVSRCKKHPGAAPARYCLGRGCETQITVDDPVFSVEVTPTKAIVQVTYGFVDVDTSAPAPAVTVGPEQQATVSLTSPAPVPRVTDATVSRSDAAVTKELESDLPKPSTEPPKALEEIAPTKRLAVAIDPAADPETLAFSQAYFGRLGEAWEVTPSFSSLSSEDAIAALEAGEIDVAVTSVLADERLGTVPLLRDCGAWQLAFSRSPDFEESLGTFLEASLLSGEYGAIYERSFGRQPEYKDVDQLAQAPATWRKGFVKPEPCG
jgi:hypothetical protein